MIKSVNTIGKLIATSLLVLMVHFAAAEGGDGEKDGDKDKKGQDAVTASKDTTDKVLDLDDAEEADDTLVFEDWELPGEGGNGDGSLIDSDDNDGFGEDFNYEDGEIAFLGEEKKEVKIQPESNGLSQVAYPSDAKDRPLMERSAFVLFPNPATNTVNIRADDNPDSIVIKDLQGRILFNEAFLSHIDISEFASGTYVIQLIYADQQIQSRKFIKG